MATVFRIVMSGIFVKISPNPAKGKPFFEHIFKQIITFLFCEVYSAAMDANQHHKDLDVFVLAERNLMETNALTRMNVNGTKLVHKSVRILQGHLNVHAYQDTNPMEPIV